MIFFSFLLQYILVISKILVKKCRQKKYWSDFFWPKNLFVKIFGSELFWVTKIWVRNCFWSKNLDRKFVLGQKKFGSKKIWVGFFLGQKKFGPNYFFYPQIFWSEIFLGQKKCWSEKFWVKKIKSEIFLGQKKFGQKFFWVKNILGLKLF